MTNAIYEAGFGSSSRGYEGAQLGMTPARFAKGGKGEKISYATAATAFGRVIVGATERGLCWLALAATAAEAEASLREEFPLAELRRDPSLARLVDAAVASVTDGCLEETAAGRRRSICAARRFSFACGRLCARFRAARRAPIANWPARWACPGNPRRGPRLRPQPGLGAGTVPPGSRRQRLAHRVPVSEPLAPTTRWQGSAPRPDSGRRRGPRAGGFGLAHLAGQLAVRARLAARNVRSACHTRS